MLDGRDLTTVPVDKIALARVGRAFQHAELFPHMTVSENLLVGRHLLIAPGIFSGAFYFGRARREEMEERKTIEHIIDFFELYRYRDMPAGDLPYGVQKLVGVARALALDPKLLLLDEPSTGLMREEKENFARYLLRIRHELHLTVLWVEHDMQLVADLADRIVVLSYGEVIADGAPEIVRKMSKVVEAYLGAGEAAPKRYYARGLPVVAPKVPQCDSGSFAAPPELRERRAKASEEPILTTVPRHLVEGERVGFHSGVEPKDAATLIIIDQAGNEPKVCLAGATRAMCSYRRNSFFPVGVSMPPTARCRRLCRYVRIPKENCWQIPGIRVARMPRRLR